MPGGSIREVDSLAWDTLDFVAEDKVVLTYWAVFELACV